MLPRLVFAVLFLSMTAVIGVGPEEPCWKCETFNQCGTGGDVIQYKCMDVRATYSCCDVPGWTYGSSGGCSPAWEFHCWWTDVPTQTSQYYQHYCCACGGPCPE